jgi:tetratricopeptide (TPR) repeat protein
MNRKFSVFLIPILLIFVLVIGLSCEKKGQSVSKPKTDPNAQLAATLHQEGIKLYWEGKYQEAINAWLKENELTPNRANVNNNIGIGYRKLKDFKTAMEYHRKAIEIDPKYGHAHYCMGLVYYELKNYEEAASAFQKAAELNVNDIDAHYSLALALLNLKEYQRAKASLEKVIGLNPSFRNAQDQLRWVNFEIMKNSIVKNSDLATAEDFFKLGMAYWERGQFVHVAADAFKKAIEIDPSYPDAHYRLGYIYERQGKKDLAMLEYEKELEFHPASENAISHIYFLKGILLSKVDTSRFFSKYSAFQGIGFPTKGIVIAGKSVLYAMDLYHKGRELLKGDGVTIVGLFDKKLEKDYKNDFFYILEGGKELLNTRDVILESRYENPTYVSPKKRFQVVKNPVSGDEFHLWLRLDKKDLIHLAKVSIIPEIDPDDDRSNKSISINDVYYEVHGKYNPVSWSPDERYLFVECTGEVFTPEGKSIKLSSETYSSPLWHGNLLFSRGVGKDDAVYMFDLNTKEFRKFLDIPDGERKRGDVRVSNIRTWLPVEIKNNTMKIIFERYNKKAKNIDEGCMMIEVIADMNGKIIKKKKEIYGCEDAY